MDRTAKIGIMMEHLVCKQLLRLPLSSPSAYYDLINPVSYLRFLAVPPKSRAGPPKDRPLPPRESPPSTTCNSETGDLTLTLFNEET